MSDHIDSLFYGSHNPFWQSTIIERELMFSIWIKTCYWCICVSFLYQSHAFIACSVVSNRFVWNPYVKVFICVNVLTSWGKYNCYVLFIPPRCPSSWVPSTGQSSISRPVATRWVWSVRKWSPSWEWSRRRIRWWIATWPLLLRTTTSLMREIPLQLL